MKALVLERQGELALRDIDLAQTMGPNDVKIAIHTVGICGSDVHYYTHGRIGPYVVEQPMVLGHEAAGTITAIGANVRHLAVGDRVCMEPGIPDRNSREYREGNYNVDPAVVFWATPPVHGVLTAEVVHPADFTYRLPDTVGFDQGAMVEPFAVAMQAATKARIRPGDIALVLGAGPIGIMTAIAAIAGGCARVLIADFSRPKLEIAARYDAISAVDLNEKGALAAAVLAATSGRGVDLVFECSGAAKAWEDALTHLRPAGCIVAVGLPVHPIAIDISALTGKEARIESVFRYAHQYERTLALLESGKVDLRPLISATLPFAQAVEAFERAAEGRAEDVKLQITLV